MAVLWTTLLLGLLAGQVLRYGRGDAQLAANVMETARTALLAEGAADVAILAVMNSADETAMLTDGSVYGWKFGEYSLFTRTTVEAGRVDINNASAELLANLVLATGFRSVNSLGIANAIIETRGGGPAGRSPERRGETALESPSPGSKGAPFQAIDELLSVQGISPALFARLKPLVTVHSGRAIPDPAAALPAVRSALTGSGSATGPGARVSLMGFTNLASAPRRIVPGSGSGGRSAQVYRVEAAAIGPGGAFSGVEMIVDLGGTTALPYRLLAKRMSDWASN